MNLILKRGGKITAYASAGGKTISQSIEWLAPALPQNPAASITAYGGGVALDASLLRGKTALPLIILVEAQNQRGEVIVSAEVRGIIVPAYRFTVSLSPHTPPSAYYERGDTWNNFSAVVFTAGPYDRIRIQQITLTRQGGTDADLLNIHLFDGSTRVGRVDRFSGGKAVIGLDTPFIIPEGTSKVLTVKADIDSNASTYTIESGISLGIVDSSDVEAINVETGGIVVPSNFIPVFGNPMGIE